MVEYVHSLLICTSSPLGFPTCHQASQQDNTYWTKYQKADGVSTLVTLCSVLRSVAVQNLLCWLACFVLYNRPPSPKFQIFPSQLSQTAVRAAGLGIKSLWITPCEKENLIIQLLVVADRASPVVFVPFWSGRVHPVVNGCAVPVALGSSELVELFLMWRSCFFSSWNFWAGRAVPDVTKLFPQSLDLLSW